MYFKLMTFMLKSNIKNLHFKDKAEVDLFLLDVQTDK